MLFKKKMIKINIIIYDSTEKHFPTGLERKKKYAALNLGFNE